MKILIPINYPFFCLVNEERMSILQIYKQLRLMDDKELELTESHWCQFSPWNLYLTRNLKSSSSFKETINVSYYFALSNSDRYSDSKISTLYTSTNVYWAVIMYRHSLGCLGNGTEQTKIPCSSKAYIHLIPLATSWSVCYY